MKAATPGPWRARPCECAPVCKRWVIDVPQNTNGRFDEPDARLAIAAPALRDALAFALMEEGRCEHPECDCWRKRAQEALKAAGR